MHCCLNLSPFSVCLVTDANIAKGPSSYPLYTGFRAMRKTFRCSHNIPARHFFPGGKERLKPNPNKSPASGQEAGLSTLPAHGQVAPPRGSRDSAKEDWTGRAWGFGQIANREGTCCGERLHRGDDRDISTTRP